MTEMKISSSLFHSPEVTIIFTFKLSGIFLSGILKNKSLKLKALCFVHKSEKISKSNAEILFPEGNFSFSS